MLRRLKTDGFPLPPESPFDKKIFNVFMTYGCFSMYALYHFFCGVTEFEMTMKSNKMMKKKKKKTQKRLYAATVPNEISMYNRQRYMICNVVM